MPRKIWLVMTPELPRAPISAPKLIAAGDPLGRLAGDAFGLVERRLDRREHVRAGVAVGDRVDVERVDLVDVRLEVGDGRPERLEQARRRRTRGGPSGDVRAAVGEVARSRPRRGPRAATAGSAPPGSKRRPSTWIVSRRDLAVERVAERVADRRVDLAGDLGDRHAVGDGEVELDRRSAGRRGGRAMPGLAEPEPLEERARARPPAKPGHAVRPERRRPHDVDDGASGDERSTGRRVRSARGRRPPGGLGIGRRRGGAVARPCAILPPRSGLPGPDPSSRPLPEDHAWPAPARSAARCRWAASTRSRRA